MISATTTDCTLMLLVLSLYHACLSTKSCRKARGLRVQVPLAFSRDSQKLHDQSDARFFWIYCLISTILKHRERLLAHFRPSHRRSAPIGACKLFYSTSVKLLPIHLLNYLYLRIYSITSTKPQASQPTRQTIRSSSLSGTAELDFSSFETLRKMKVGESVGTTLVTSLKLGNPPS